MAKQDRAGGLATGPSAQVQVPVGINRQLDTGPRARSCDLRKPLKGGNRRVTSSRRLMFCHLAHGCSLILGRAFHREFAPVFFDEHLHRLLHCVPQRCFGFPPQLCAQQRGSGYDQAREQRMTWWGRMRDAFSTCSLTRRMLGMRRSESSYPFP